MKKAGNWLAASWTGLLSTAILVLGLAFVLWWSLDSLLPGLSQSEVQYIEQTSSIQKIIDNPLGLPHKALSYAVQLATENGAAVRLVSTIFAFSAVVSLHYVLKSWYSPRIAVLGSLLLATSAWFLHIGRIGTDQSMYLLLFVAVACLAWLQNSQGKALAISVSSFVLVMLLYIPGMIWFIAPMMIWQFGRIAQLLQRQNIVILSLLSLLAVIAISPIGWSLYHNPELIKTYIGLPQTLAEPLQTARNIAEVPMQIFIRGPESPETWLARLPLVNIFATVMFIIGAYAFAKKWQLDRTASSVYVFIVGAILAGLNGPVNISVLLPFIYLIIAGGIALMLQQWFVIFPKNPFARTTGAILLTSAVMLAAYYGFYHYFIAWPNTPETKQTFKHQLK